MSARDVTECPDAGQQSQPECESDGNQVGGGATRGTFYRQDGRGTDEDQDEGPEELGKGFLDQQGCLLL